MVLESSDMPTQYNLAAAAACWVMLAGFFYSARHIHCTTAVNGAELITKWYTPGRARGAKYITAATCWNLLRSGSEHHDFLVVPIPFKLCLDFASAIDVSFNYA